MTTSEVRSPYLVAAVGFGGFEQQVLDSYLGLALARTPAYAPCAAVEDAQFIIANADRGGVLDLLAAGQRMGDTVLVGQVGQAQVAGAAATLARPIDPLHLFRALDEALERRSLAATAARASPRNVTMADISTPWSHEGRAQEGQHSAAFYAPPSTRATTSSDVRRRGEWPPRADFPASRRKTFDWPVSNALPADRSIPTRRRHADRSAPDALLTGRPPLNELTRARAPGGQPAASMALFSNEEPEINANAAVALRAPSGRMPVPRPATEALSALVVDEAEAQALVPLFAAQNVKATCVGKAHHAFAMLDAFAFDVIVIGVDLGSTSELDGLQFCQALARQQRAPGEFCPPIVLMSAQPTALEQSRAMLAGGNVYLAKPARPATLAQALVHAGLRPAWTLADMAGSVTATTEPIEAGAAGTAGAAELEPASAPR